jgi:hypothetical protein
MNQAPTRGLMSNAGVINQAPARDKNEFVGAQFIAPEKYNATDQGLINQAPTRGLMSNAGVINQAPARDKNEFVGAQFIAPNIFLLYLTDFLI